MWNSIIILGEEYWQIDITLLSHETEDEALKTAQDDGDDIKFVMIDGKPGIQVTLQGEKHHYFDSNVVITEISKEKQAQMGRPLDMSNPDDQKMAIEALKSFDPAYTIQASDMVPSEKTLKDFIARYGVGYQMSPIAYAVKPVTKQEIQ